MRIIPYKTSALRLLQEGSIALARVEGNGIRMDVDYLLRIDSKTEKKISRMEEDLREDEVGRKWLKMYGRKMNLDSTEQLGRVLFDGMGYTPPNLTKTGKYKVDEKSLEDIDHPFVQKFLEMKKLRKILSTYIRGIHKEIVDGYLHPFFDLQTARTFRSSSSSPNFQNIPVRNPELGDLIRRSFIAREGRRLVEIDYAGIEVCIAACYHKDPTMLTYIKDKSKDMHRDMAQECFLLPKEEMSNPVDAEDKARIKQIRYCGKNMFVFPQFYGDWYLECARSLWNAISRMKLKTRDGRSLKIHLKEMGIDGPGEFNPREKPRPGTFEHHLKKVERGFWEDRFPVYDKWKKLWVSKYQKNGYLLTKTGFICQGDMGKNEIINYPVQGSAFHCLLQALIWIVTEEIRKRRMKTLIVGQIHDSIIADVPDEEMDEFVSMVKEIMTKKLPEIWRWIITPLEIEIEASPLDGSWADKKEIKA